jgi:hypothetical protein
MSLSAISRRSTFLTMVLAGSLSAQAMPPPGGPPPYLQIVREEVKVGRGGAPHLQAEVGWPRAFGKAKIANNYLALTTLYGPNEAWFVEGHNSIAEIEAVNKAIADAPGLSQELDRLTQADAANITNVRTLLGRFQASMSNPGSVSPPEMRAWEIIIFRVRPGHEGDFVQATNLYRSLVEQTKVEAPWATYQVMAGMPGPAFLILVPHKTLAEIDPATGVGAAIEKAMTEETMKKFGTLSEGFLSVENMVFAPSPEMSYLSAEWIAQDAKYWGRKTVSAMKPAGAAGNVAQAAAPKP